MSCKKNFEKYLKYFPVYLHFIVVAFEHLYGICNFIYKYISVYCLSVNRLNGLAVILYCGQINSLDMTVDTGGYLCKNNLAEC